MHLRQIILTSIHLHVSLSILYDFFIRQLIMLNMTTCLKVRADNIPALIRRYKGDVVILRFCSGQVVEIISREDTLSILIA